jgi:hypothetical protein
LDVEALEGPLLDGFSPLLAAVADWPMARALAAMTLFIPSPKLGSSAILIKGLAARAR